MSERRRFEVGHLGGGEWGVRVHHVPRLVTSGSVKGDGLLERTADAVSGVVGDMRLFISVSLFIASWMVVGGWLRFDPAPWPLLLMLMNIPQLPIMISLQVSANRAERQRDAKAEADHETLTAIHGQQDAILRQQDAILLRLPPGSSLPPPGLPPGAPAR